MYQCHPTSTRYRYKHFTYITSLNLEIILWGSILHIFHTNLPIWSSQQPSKVNKGKIFPDPGFRIGSAEGRVGVLAFQLLTAGQWRCHWLLQVRRKWQSDSFENVSEKALDRNLKSAKRILKGQRQNSDSTSYLCFYQQQEIRKLNKYWGFPIVWGWWEDFESFSDCQVKAFFHH